MPNPVLQRLVDERGQTQENIDKLLDRANEEERDPTESERELIVSHRARLDQLEPMIGELLEVEETRSKAADARGALTRTRRETPGDPPAPGDPPPDDGGEEPEGEYTSFARYARDAILTRFDRIGASVPVHQRHQAQERLQRAVAKVLTADVGPLVQPQYINQIMQVIDNSRPLVAASNRVNLASGKLEWPQITNRPEVGVQATEKTEAGDGAMTVDVLNTVATTYLVAANFSWQTVQWSNPDAMRLWFDLAAADYAKKTDAAAGAVLAAADTTPTVVASNDLEGWMAAIAAAAGEVYAATGRFPNGLALNPADGFQLLGLVAQVAPVFLTTGAGNLSTGQFPAIGGLRFIATNGLPAGTGIVGDFSALLTAENAGAPVELRAVEPSIGGIEVGIIGAFAAAITDPGAFQEITGPPVVP